MINEFRERDDRLSVVIPNYNHARHIGAAVEAVAAQRPAPGEIIVIDDASTDDSLLVLGALAEAHPTLRLVALRENGGAIAALNRGLKEARGAYVYFGAADDLTRPGLFRETLALALSHPEAALASAEGEVVDMDTGVRGVRPPVRPAHEPTFFPPAAVADQFRRIDNWILTGAAVVRRDLLLEAGGFDGALGAMADGYALRRLAFRHGCCFVPVIGLVWQVRASGLSRSQAADPEEGMRALDLALGRMRADPVFPPWYPPLLERRWRFALARLAAQANPVNLAVLRAVGATGPIGRAALAAAGRVGGRAGTLAALGWLTLRHRPTSLAGLVSTWWARRRA